MRKNCFMNGSVVFSCSILDFIIMSFLFTNIDIVILMCFVVYCSYLWDINLFFSCKKWAIAFRNANGTNQSAFTKCYHHSDISVFINSQVTIKLMREWKVRPIEGRSPLFKANFVRRKHISYQVSFRFCKRAMHVGSPESFPSRIIRQMECRYAVV